MESVGEGKSEKQLSQMIASDLSLLEDIDVNTKNINTDFIGIMVETDFYYIFWNKFSLLDV